MRRMKLFATLSLLLCVAGCAKEPSEVEGATRASLILTNARVYTLSWDDPAPDGSVAHNAPHDESGWHPDAEAIAVRDGQVLFVGSNADAMVLKGELTRVVDLDGATVIPGLVDSHTHVFELGKLLDQVNLVGVATEEQAVALIVERAKSVPKGEWIIGRGWDEGAWANRYPDKALLTEAVPDHPVFMESLHSFAGWGNQMALDSAGITAETAVPVGGEMRLGSDGQPGGLFLNRGVELLREAIPEPSRETLTKRLVLGLQQMATDGYTTVHDAGLDAESMSILEELETADKLLVRVYAMLSLRDEDLIRKWIEKGPDNDTDSMLVTRSVKAFYDGALGSRGARLLHDYTDQPGHRGISGDSYGFNQALNAEAMKAGFQIAIHAIGDAGNREAMDILETVFHEEPSTASNRHRIEHAQVLTPGDIPRLGQLGIIASMEPPHAMEDKAWAEERLGPERILGAYAWRSLIEAGARLTFNSDNPGSDHNIFYGLHSAITRQDKNRQPEGGWYADQRVTADEAVRAYSKWSAYASFREDETGVIEAGRWADLTVMDVDPFALADESPTEILGGRIMMTIVNGKVVYESADEALSVDNYSCDSIPRPENSKLPLSAFSDDWYQVYESSDGVYSIVEPYQLQETISHLIVGDDRALLFDTGVGLLSIKAVVERITHLPVIVLNSHTHYDHVGGNWEFSNVLAIDSDYTRANMEGFDNSRIAGDFLPEAFCKGAPEESDSESFYTRPWKQSRYVEDGEIIDLGGRTLEVLHIPGHTPDAVALIDVENRLLFTGDSWYDASLWLFARETSLKDYEASISRLATMEGDVDFLLGAHNSARIDAGRLQAVVSAFRQLRAGDYVAERDGYNRLAIEIDGVRILTAQAALDGNQGDISKGGSGLESNADQ